MRVIHFLPALAILAACSSPDATNTSLPLAPARDVSAHAVAGQVYAMSNAPSGNAILAFDRLADGSLVATGSYPTGGVGTGGGLGNQGGVVVTDDGRFLLAVNAGSHDVTSFAIRANGALEVVGTWPSGGTMPTSVTVARHVVYVLNAGGAGNVTGFDFRDGRLTMIAGSTRPLSGSAVAPAQVQLTRDATRLVVSERASNRLSTYTVDAAGFAAGPTAFASSGVTPFGFAIRNDLVVVSEAFGGAADASAVSSYALGRDGSLTTLSPSVGTTETAACWLVITNDGRYAYAANAGSGTISGYAISQGRLTLLDASGVTGTAAAGITDLALSRDSRFLYARVGGASRTVMGYRINADGSLTPLPAATVSLPAGANGLAAR